VPAFYRKKASEQAESLRNKLDKLVTLSSLSVYRLRNSEPFEIKDRTGRKIISPVDFRLDQLKRELTIFQLELSQEINIISTKLQKDVLASILYSDGVESNIKIPRNFDQKREKRELFQAYKRLNALDGNIRKKIISHIEVIDEAMSRLNKKEELTQKDFEAFQSFVRTQEIIEMSLASENQINKTYKPISDFLETVHEFINDKTFEFESGDLTAFNEEFDDISTQKLSSGEKQLLIILIETLLQKRERCVFLTDEPELSLHIQWQRNILPAIKKLNPNAQIIAATHSPEIAAKYKSSLIDMQMVINNA
jgi:predicted ATPase